MRHGTLLQTVFIDVAGQWWRTRNQGRADTFYITSIQIPSLQRWQRGDIACNARIKCQGNQCFAFWLLWLQIHLIMALVMSRSAAWGELVHIKEYLVISRIEHSTNVKLFLLWASEIPAKYFSIFDYSRERNILWLATVCVTHCSNHLYSKSRQTKRTVDWWVPILAY